MAMFHFLDLDHAITTAAPAAVGLEASNNQTGRESATAAVVAIKYNLRRCGTPLILRAFFLSVELRYQIALPSL